MPIRNSDVRPVEASAVTPAMCHYFETGETPGSTPRAVGLYGWYQLLVDILPRKDADEVLAPYRAAWEAERRR